MAAPVPPRRYLGNDSPEIKIDDVKGKGKGVVAVQQIQPNWRIAYKGITITTAEYDQLVERSLRARKNSPESKLVSYIMSSGRAGELIDANPARVHEISGLVNEPSTGVTANMRLEYETWHGKKRPVFIAVRVIEVGEELTAKYATRGFKRTGYRPGRIAPLPSWWKRRDQ